MKIIISPKEKYELEIEPEYTLEGFKSLVKKLNVVVSFIDGKDTSAKQISLGKKSTTPRSREEIREILNIYFTMSPGSPEMEDALKKFNLTYITANQYKWKWIEKFRFKPEDFGLTVFPEKTGGSGRPKSSIN